VFVHQIREQQTPIMNVSNPIEFITSIFLSCASTEALLLFSHDPTEENFLYALLQCWVILIMQEKVHHRERFRERMKLNFRF
jgi:hypothetical protein